MKGIPPIIILLVIVAAIIQSEVFWIVVGVFAFIMVVVIIASISGKEEKKELTKKTSSFFEDSKPIGEGEDNNGPGTNGGFGNKDAYVYGFPAKLKQPYTREVMLGKNKDIKCIYTTYYDIPGGDYKAELQGVGLERHKVLKNFNKTLLECDVRNIVERWDKEDEEEKKAQEKRRRAEEERKKSIERVRLSYKIENILPDGVLDVDKISGSAKGDTIEEKCLGLLRTSKYPIKWECRPDVSFSGGVLIVDYSLRTVRYSLKGTKIPAFVGNIVMESRLSAPLQEIWQLLVALAPYSGIGIKTTLGMGGVFSESTQSEKIT